MLLVAVTGWGEDEDRRRAEVAGFDHHLAKPVDLETLEPPFAERFFGGERSR
jgi:CheY-like chemotaxis protein